MNYLSAFLFFCATLGCIIAELDINKYRLPHQVKPLSYSLKFQPFIHEGYFKGETYIQIRVSSEIDAIYLHGSYLNISEVKIVGDLEKVQVTLEEEYSLIRVSYENGDKILAGDNMLYFKYQGTLLHADQMGMVKGMYSYGNETGILMVTDFQPTYARRAYPCFDEPAFKASFNVTIVTPDPSWVALSNTEEISREETAEGVIYTFESSPPMSTDLTSFVMTKMDYIENIYEDNKKYLKIRTFLGNAKQENETFVLNFAAKCVKYLEDLTGVEYPLSKIDFIEYDKIFTATEYWGLTTFKRGLLNPSLDLYDHRQISIVVAHELTHYWFGNLVTNQWWRDIWLQEGFAQYLSHKVVDGILNTTNVEEYPLDYTFQVFKEDRTSKKVNPVVINVTTPVEIMTQFNDITYIKAGSLLRLLDFTVGEENFRKLLQKYIKGYAYNSASTEDFLSVAEAIFPDYIREYLETWLFQNRFPIIEIMEDLNEKQYVLRQKSASVFEKTDNMSIYGYKWTIPIFYTTDLKRTPSLVWFKKDAEYITIPKGEEVFLKLNYNFMGIYFTNYTTSMWENLIEHAQLLNEMDQVHLVWEAAELFESDVLNCDITLRLIARVSSEPNQFGLSPLSPLFTLRDNLSFDSSAVALLRKFYYSVRAKSKLARRKDEDEKGKRRKHKRDISFDSVGKTESSNSIDDLSSTEKNVEQKPHPRFLRCSKWIHENLSYLI